MRMKKYPCERCGMCCRQVGRSFWGKKFATADGTCKFLDRKTNLCTIYDHRPLICNVDKYYDIYLSNEMSRQDFYQKNKEMCQYWQKERG